MSISGLLYIWEKLNFSKKYPKMNPTKEMATLKGNIGIKKKLINSVLKMYEYLLAIDMSNNSYNSFNSFCV